MDRHDEVDAGEDAREAVDEDPEADGDDVRVRVGRREGRVEGPARVDAAVEERPEREEGADVVEVPRREVQLREGDVLRPDHQREEEVAEDAGHGGDEEEEDHHHAVHREDAVVPVGGDEVALRRRQLDADQGRHQAADGEVEADRDEVEDRDPLVVQRQEPRLQPPRLVQVVDRGVARRVGRGGLRIVHRQRVPPAPAAGGGSFLTYSTSCSSSSSVMTPLNVGMIGW